MIYQILRSSEDQLSFVTAKAARRGRGILFSLAPIVLLSMAASVLFAVSTDPLWLWQHGRQWVLPICWILPGLTIVGFLVGYRIREQVEARPKSLRIGHTRWIGMEQSLLLAREELVAFAIEPNIRSLGADILLLARHCGGKSTVIAEGEPHSGQMHRIAEQLSRVMALPLEPHRFSDPKSGRSL